MKSPKTLVTLLAVGVVSSAASAAWAANIGDIILLTPIIGTEQFSSSILIGRIDKSPSSRHDHTAAILDRLFYTLAVIDKHPVIIPILLVTL